MLDHILGCIQSFERRHGLSPNAVYINHSHYQLLHEECPGLFSDTVTHALGFHLILVPDCELAHPRIGWIPPRLQVGPEARQQKPATVVALDDHRCAV
ncbi:MAG: hypothetical protein ACWGOV_06800 [Acidiferrobacterales bacterium]